MAQFAYEARDAEGQLRTGYIDADSVEQAGQTLSERALFVVRLAADRDNAKPERLRGRATRAQVAWQMSQLSIMIDTGIRISEALDCLSKQAREPKLRLLLEEVSRSVQEGRSLSDAMAQFPDSYPRSLVAMIRASEMSGTMGEVLHRCSDYLLTELQIIKRVRNAMLYPLFMLILCLAITVFLLTVILPRFESIFADRGAVLPAPTRVMMALSQNMLQYWAVWIVSAGAVVGGAFAWLRTDTGRAQSDALLIRLPVLERVFNTLYQSRAFRTLSVLLDAGVPLVETMRVLRDVTPNRQYRELWKQVDGRIRHGESMAGPILTSPLIPEPVAQMIDSGDRSGRLTYVFGRLADFVEQEFDDAVKTATQFIEPCMILLMGGLVGFIASALMLPLFQASRVAAG